MVQLSLKQSVVSTSPTTWANQEVTYKMVLSALIVLWPYGYDNLSHPLRACTYGAGKTLALSQCRFPE